MIAYHDKGWRPEAPPLQERQVNRAPRGSGQAGSLTDLTLGLGWGPSVERLAELHARAAEMRRNPTESEKRLWRALSGSQLEGHKFRRQSVIGAYIADFLCPQRALIVEVDGDTHDGAKDRLRDDDLAEDGFTVLRVTNQDVMTNIDGVGEAIRLALASQPPRWNRPHPNPSPEGEGLER